MSDNSDDYLAVFALIYAVHKHTMLPQAAVHTMKLILEQVKEDERERCVHGYEEIREIYAGMDGFISETAAEGYQQRIIKQMYDIAIQEIKSPGDTENGS